MKLNNNQCIAWFQVAQLLHIPSIDNDMIELRNIFTGSCANPMERRCHGEHQPEAMTEMDNLISSWILLST